jgi:hypothetical protein
MAVRRGASARLDVVAVVGLCAFGAAIRAPGLTSRDLWFDDAWAALPAHVGFAHALRMVVTTPIYTMGLRTWIQVTPGDTWWAQLPALVLGIAGIAAVYGLVRALGFSRLSAYVAAAAIAAGPITVTYSTRVKEYSADLLLACLVLWLVERWRSSPSRKGATLLAVASVAAMWISASTAAVVGGAAACVLCVAWSRRDLRRQAVGLLGVLVVSAVALWAIFLRRIPSQLRVNWRTHGFLFGYADAHHVAFAFQQTFSGVAHGLLGLPIPYTFEGDTLRDVPMALSVATALALVALVAPPLLAALRSRGSRVGPTLASAATIVVATIGTLSGVSPLGDGRTDEALYPALLVLGVGGVTALARRLRTPARAHAAVRWALVGAVAVAALWFGIDHTATYPPTGLRTVFQRLEPQLRPGDVVVVDGYESFTWGDEGLRAWAVSFHQGAVPWPMGFHVASRDPSVVLSTNYLQPDAAIFALSKRTHRVWYVGPTVGGYSTSAPSSLWTFPFSTPTLSFFAGPGPWPNYPGAHGWRPARVCCGYSGTFAWLFVHP